MSSFLVSEVITVPIKPSPEVLGAAKRKLDPRSVLEVVINETPALKSALLAANLKDSNGKPIITETED